MDVGLPGSPFYRKGKTPLASDSVYAIPSNSVTLLDKGFFSADLQLSIQNTPENRHWMIPERKGTVFTGLECYGDGDCLVLMKVLPQARKRTHWPRITSLPSR
jgi:hypothetical protein